MAWAGEPVRESAAPEEASGAGISCVDTSCVETSEIETSGADPTVAETTAALAERLRDVTVIDPGAAERRWLGKPISLSLRDADLQEVLRSFAKLAEVNLILDPRVAGKVTVELEDVPWDQALYVILKTHGLGIEITGSVWGVAPVRR